MSRALRAAELTGASALLVVFLSARDLPLVDLPQHVLQLTNWLRIDAGDPTTASLELNFRTPYLLGYPVARVLAELLPVLTAWKLVLWAAITLQALALRRLCVRLGHDPWLGLLGFPLGLGYSFCFGLVAFSAALPLIYLAFDGAVAQRERPSFKQGCQLALTLMALLVAHGVALGFALIVLGPWLLGGNGKWWQRLWPTLSPLLLALVWLVPGGSPTRLGGDVWAFEPRRLLELPGQLVGIGSADVLATVGGCCLLGVLFSSLGRPRPLPWLLPLATSLAGYLLFPSMFRGAGPLGPRFSAYLVPALLLGFAPRVAESRSSQRFRRALSILAAAGPLALFGFRLIGFNQETADFRALLARLPRGMDVRPIVFERGSRAFPGIPAHLHLPAYYAVEKGGSAGYSFAMYPISVVRSRPGQKIRMGGGAEWAPQTFDAAREADDYDYFIVKSSVDRTASLFPGPRPVAELEQRVGDWWGYRRAVPRRSTATAETRR